MAGSTHGKIAIVMVLMTSSLAFAAGARKEFKFNAAPGTNLNIVNQFGSTTLHPASGNQISIVATTQSDKVEIDCTQNGNHVDTRSHFLQRADDKEGRVDYEVGVPPGMNVSVQTATGSIEVSHVTGELTVKTDSASTNVHDLSASRLHIRTVSGPVTINNVNGSHVDIVSTSGKVDLTAVAGPSVSVNTTSGDISYDGDFGAGGDYNLSNHTGMINVSLPATASVDISAQTVNGSVQNDFPLQPKTHTTFPLVAGRSFAGTSNSGSSSVELHSFGGTIRVKKR